MNQNDFDTLIERFLAIRDKNGNPLNMASVIVSQGNCSFSYYFQPRAAVDIRSIAKPIVCLALGIAIEKGLYFGNMRIDLNTPIWEFLSRYAQIRDPLTAEKWKLVRLIDCLRITLGHDKGLVFSADVKVQGEENLVDYIVNYPIDREVGRDFTYSNAGTFLVSTLITEYLGKNLNQFVLEYLFSPLGIRDYRWKNYGKYCAGCTGLVFHNEDLHKIGRLIMNGGVYNGRQLVPRHWIDLMRSPLVMPPTHRYRPDRAFPKWSYGLNLWICEDGNYYCDGTDGQYMVFIAKKDVVITTLGYQSDTEPVSNCLGLLK
jgi:CubicO group peptidase (beta-lactamase class C family)